MDFLNKIAEFMTTGLAEAPAVKELDEVKVTKSQINDKLDVS